MPSFRACCSIFEIKNHQFSRSMHHKLFRKKGELPATWAQDSTTEATEVFSATEKGPFMKDLRHPSKKGLLPGYISLSSIPWRSGWQCRLWWELGKWAWPQARWWGPRGTRRQGGQQVRWAASNSAASISSSTPPAIWKQLRHWKSRASICYRKPSRCLCWRTSLLTLPPLLPLYPILPSPTYLATATWARLLIHSLIECRLHALLTPGNWSSTSPVNFDLASAPSQCGSDLTRNRQTLQPPQFAHILHLATARLEWIDVNVHTIKNDDDDDYSTNSCSSCSLDERGMGKINHLKCTVNSQDSHPLFLANSDQLPPFPSSAEGARRVHSFSDNGGANLVAMMWIWCKDGNPGHLNSMHHHLGRTASWTEEFEHKSDKHGSWGCTSSIACAPRTSASSLLRAGFLRGWSHQPLSSPSLSLAVCSSVEKWWANVYFST